MSNHSVIEHRANYHFLKLEEDYVLICSQGKQYPHCKAFILAILEQWTNDKLSKGQSPHIYMTYPQWIDALYGLFRRNHVIDCLAELIQEKLIFRQPCRLHGKDTFEYSLNVQEVQVRLSKLPERTEKYSRPKINPFKFKRVEKQTRPNLDDTTDTNLNGSEHEDASKFGHNIDSSTEIPSDINSEREVAPATARSQSSSQNDLSEDDEDTVEREAVKASQILAVRLIDGTEALAQVEKREGDTLRVIWLEPQKQYVQAWSDVFGNKHFPFESTLPSKSNPHYTNHGIQAFGDYRILSKNEVDGLSIIPLYRRIDKKEAIHGHAHQHPIVDRDIPADSHQPEHRKEDTNKVTEPPAPRKPRANTVPRRPKQQGLMDELPEPPPPEAIAIMDLWDSNHTKPSPRGEKTIKAAILLIPFNPTKEELKACEEWLFTTDRPGKPWYRSHGVHLPDIAEKIGSWQSLQNAPPAKPEKEPSNEHKAAGFYSNGAIFERNKAKTEAKIAEALAWDEARRAREVQA